MCINQPRVSIDITAAVHKDDDMNLNDHMELDHVVQVHADGTVTDAPDGIYGPESAYDDKVEIPWTLMRGYTGQYSYNGPTMHPSEYIGGGIERDILATPGYYVVIASVDSAEDDPDDALAGWCVAYIDAEAYAAFTNVG